MTTNARAAFCDSRDVSVLIESLPWARNYGLFGVHLRGQWGGGPNCWSSHISINQNFTIKKSRKVSHFINRIRTIDFIFVALIWDLDLIRYNLVFNYQLSFLNCSILQDKWVQWDRQLATSIAYWHKRFPSISELQVERKYSYLTVFIPRLIKYPFYKEILLFQLFSRWFDVGFRM